MSQPNGDRAGVSEDEKDQAIAILVASMRKIVRSDPGPAYHIASAALETINPTLVSEEEGWY